VDTESLLAVTFVFMPLWTWPFLVSFWSVTSGSDNYDLVSAQSVLARLIYGFAIGGVIGMALTFLVWVWVVILPVVLVVLLFGQVLVPGNVGVARVVGGVIFVLLVGLFYWVIWFRKGGDTGFRRWLLDS
jgi:hypothetical protein